MLLAVPRSITMSFRIYSSHSSLARLYFRFRLLVLFLFGEVVDRFPHCWARQASHDLVLQTRPHGQRHISLDYLPSITRKTATWVSGVMKSSAKKGVKKPSVPIWKEITGGTVLGNSKDAKRRVPSPPNVTTKSTRLLRLYRSWE